VDSKKIAELIKILNDNDLSEVTVEEKGEKITVRRGAITIVEQAGAGTKAKPGQDRKPPVHVSGNAADEETARLAASYSHVESPMVGTFYLAAAPGGEPFVTEGASFEKGETLCVIEAMKLMNEIIADEAGKIVKIAAKDGEPVEFGQPLFFYEPLT